VLEDLEWIARVVCHRRTLPRPRRGVQSRIRRIRRRSTATAAVAGTATPVGPVPLPPVRRATYPI
jgi:hypothetical protein